jgi:hypothetical protein
MTMTKQRILFLIGIWVAVLPFLGFPSIIRNVFFLVTGLGIILLSYFMYIQTKAISEMDEKGGGIFAKEEDLEDESIEDSEVDVSLEAQEYQKIVEESLEEETQSINEN